MVTAVGQSQDRADGVGIATNAEGENGKGSQEDLLWDRHILGNGGGSERWLADG